jgi:hypothetical protein
MSEVGNYASRGKRLKWLKSQGVLWSSFCEEWDSKFMPAILRTKYIRIFPGKYS